MRDPALEMFDQGARIIESYGEKFGPKHIRAGITEDNWDLLRQDDLWSADQAADARSFITEAINASLTVAGIPAGSMPGHYVAAVIARLVQPCNWLTACHRVPETYNAVQASGVAVSSEIVPMDVRQLMALVLEYGARGRAVEGPPGKMELPEGFEKARRDGIKPQT